MEQIINKVAESGIITLDLTPFLPAEETLAAFDLKPFLFREMILREKDYRAALQTFDWQQYTGKHVAIFCSTDAIIPVWAYMLAASNLRAVALSVYVGPVSAMTDHIISEVLGDIDLAEYTDQRVVLKGCGDVPVPESAYVAATFRLQPVVRSIMYGEPCSTVPVFKKARAV